MWYNVQADEYRASKAALNMLTIQYWKKLAGDGFKIFGVCPGLIATNLYDADAARAGGGLEPDVGGERVARVVRGDRDSDVGTFCGNEGADICRPIYPW